MIGARSIFVLVSALTALLWHPVHETICEVEWNADTHRMEVALRLDVLDEQWLKERWFKPSQDADAAAQKSSQPNWQSEYLTQHLYFDPVHDRASGTTTGRPLKWVGKKLDGAHVWWFFEVVCDDGRPPQSIRTGVLFEREQNYQHRLTVLAKDQPNDAKRPTLVLTEQQPSARFPGRLSAAN